MDRDAKLVMIGYQINTPEVTTMGACKNGCGRMSRGAATCADCLAGDDESLKAHVRKLREARIAHWERQERESKPWRG